MGSVSSEAVDALGRLVKHTSSSSLKILRLKVQNGDSLLGLAEALKFNHSLKELSLVEEQKIAADMCEMEAFQTTLKHYNFTLEELHLGTWPGWHVSAPDREKIYANLALINFCLELNSAGQDKLLGRDREAACAED